MPGRQAAGEVAIQLAAVHVGMQAGVEHGVAARGMGDQEGHHRDRARPAQPDLEQLARRGDVAAVEGVDADHRSSMRAEHIAINGAPRA